MDEVICELETAAGRHERTAEELRARAAIIRAAVDLDWHGPGAAAYREQAVARWAAFLEVARLIEGLAHRLREMAGLLEAA